MKNLLLLLAACKSPTALTDPPATVPVDPLQHGIVSSCSTPGNNLADFYDGDPKLIVHGTGPGERAHAEQVLAWYPELGNPTFVAADQLTDAQRAGSDLLVLGGADSNGLLGAFGDQLPVRFDADGFIFGGYRWDNPAHGIAIYHPNPWNPEHEVLLYAGNTLGGAQALYSIFTGEQDFHVTKGRSPQMEGKLCRDGDRWGWFERRVTDFRADQEAFYAGWTTHETATHVFHYAPGSTFEGDLDFTPDYQEQAYAGILETLEVDGLDHPVHWYLYESNAEKEQATGNGGNGHADSVAYEVHAVYTPTVKAVGAHEDVHVVQKHRIGDTAYALLGEGMAVMVDDNWQGTPLDTWTQEHLSAGDLPTLTDLIDDFWGAGGGSDLGYGAGGSFNRFLIDTYGAASLKQLYGAPDVRQGFIDVLGRTDTELEADWHGFYAP